MIRCYRDEYGFRRVDANDLPPQIGSFLEGDVQSIEGCDGWLECLDNIAAGRTKDFSGAGNAYSVEIVGQAAILECLWDEDEGKAVIPLHTFRRCIESWREFIAGNDAATAGHHGHPILFTIYFNLGSFYLGLCTAFAYTTKAQGTAHAIGIVVGTLFLSVFGWSMRWLLRKHADDNDWSMIRRLAPVTCYIAGFGLVSFLG